MISSQPVEQLTKCLVCGETRSVLLFTYPDSFLPTGILQINQCQSCPQVYLNPRLCPSSTQVVEDDSEVYDFTPEVLEESVKVSMGLFSWIETFGAQKDRFLDIGCNRGILLEAGRRMAWKGIGVEISPVAARKARDDFGAEVYCRMEEALGLGPFPLILAWHVLEHTHDPVALLRQAAEALDPQGLLALQVPSFDFLESYRERDQMGSLVCAVHNFYFTQNNLLSVVSRAGFTPIFVENNSENLMLTVICSKTSLKSKIKPASGFLRQRSSSFLRRLFQKREERG